MGVVDIFTSLAIHTSILAEAIRSDPAPAGSVDYILDLLAPIIMTLIASSGFWLWLDKKKSKKSFESDLLVGLAHDRIIYLGMTYITRGYILQEEYENLHDYLYKPYERLGGNGSARRVMLEVDKLPIKKLSELTPKEYRDDVK